MEISDQVIGIIATSILTVVGGLGYGVRRVKQAGAGAAPAPLDVTVPPAPHVVPPMPVPRPPALSTGSFPAQPQAGQLDGKFMGKTEQRLDNLEADLEALTLESRGTDAAVMVLGRDLAEIQTRDKLRRELRSEILEELATKPPPAQTT